MALVERAVVLYLSIVILMMMMMMMISYAAAAVYKVGDSAGWTTLGNINYKKWSATKNFQLGDTIIFEYNAEFHNVMRVTHAMYKSCNASSPIATFSSGNDTIKITNHGHHFFFCGVPGHCQAGQKVDINVLRVVSAAAAPTPSSSALGGSPLVPASISNEPAPSPNNAIAFGGVNVIVGLLLLLLFLAMLN